MAAWWSRPSSPQGLVWMVAWGQPADVMEEAMVHLLSEVVGGGQAQVGVGDDLDLGSQVVADPADTDIIDGLTASVAWRSASGAGR